MTEERALRISDNPPADGRRNLQKGIQTNELFHERFHVSIKMFTNPMPP